jgi:hypothetical protein
MITDLRKAMRRMPFIFTALLLLTACECEYNEDPQPAISNDYLPLTVGNYWDFKAVGYSPELFTEHREVEDYVTLNGRQYYLLVSTYLSDMWYGQHRDSSYYRIDDAGFVYVYKKNRGIEENRYRLNGKDGDTWEFDFIDNFIATMKLSELSKDVGNVNVENCKDYFFDVELWADEESTFTLAPHVGFLKEFSDAWGVGQELKSARINGKHIEF